MSVSLMTVATNAVLLSDFPYLAQVFQVESWVQLTGGRSRYEIRYGLTSLPAKELPVISQRLSK